MLKTVPSFCFVNVPQWMMLWVKREGKSMGQAHCSLNIISACVEINVAPAAASKLYHVAFATGSQNLFVTANILRSLPTRHRVARQRHMEFNRRDATVCDGSCICQFQCYRYCLLWTHRDMLPCVVAMTPVAWVMMVCVVDEVSGCGHRSRLICEQNKQNVIFFTLRSNDLGVIAM